MLFVPTKPQRRARGAGRRERRTTRPGDRRRGRSRWRRGSWRSGRCRAKTRRARRPLSRQERRPQLAVDVARRASGRRSPTSGLCDGGVQGTAALGSPPIRLVGRVRKEEVGESTNEEAEQRKNPPVVELKKEGGGTTAWVAKPPFFVRGRVEEQGQDHMGRANAVAKWAERPEKMGSKEGISGGPSWKLMSGYQFGKDSPEPGSSYGPRIKNRGPSLHGRVRAKVVTI
ncbi:unnamed protein product [Linum trigynum]|uniref:Uncharacterized protein n=1 Tax=Linum trigynum TaxID=586398 RepID=A0AAV2FEB0_9ROSI